MAKTDKKPEAFAAVTLGICCSVRPPTAHLPKRAGAREASGKRGGPSRVTKRRNCRAAPALARTTPFRPKKGGANSSSLGHFFDLSGSFPPIAPTAFDTHADARSKGGETDEKALARARTSPSFGFFPSPTCSNSLEHNTLGVKISRILTHSKQPTTISESTTCKQTTVKRHEATSSSPRFTPVHPTFGRRMRA